MKKIAIRIVDAVVRYKWTAVCVFAAGAVLTITAVLRSQPRYSNTVTIWLPHAQTAADPSWIDLLQSRRVTDYVVKKHSLVVKYNDQDAPVFESLRVDTAYAPGIYTLTVDRAGRTVKLSTAESWLADSSSIGDPIGEALGFLWKPSEDVLAAGTYTFEVLNPREASRRLIESIQVNVSANSKFMRVSYHDTNPARVAAVLNSVADRFVDTVEQLRALSQADRSRAQASVIPNVRIIDRAGTPRFASEHTRMIVGLKGIALSLVIAIGVAIACHSIPLARR